MTAHEDVDHEGHSLTVAAAKTINRIEPCDCCSQPKMFRVDEGERVIASFCSNSECALFLVEVEE